MTPKQGIDEGGWRAVMKLRLVALCAIVLAAGIAVRVVDLFGPALVPSLPGIAMVIVPLLALIELEKIKIRLESDNPDWGNYRSFTITDPKERIISAAPFPERVMHHAIMNVLEPCFERQLIHHTYACRKGKGTHAAVLYAFHKAKGHSWFS